MDKVLEAKHVLRRHSKLNSLIEIEKFNNNTADPNAAAAAADKNSTTSTGNTAANTSSSTNATPSCSSNTGANKSTDHVMMDESITSLKWNDSRNTTSDENAQHLEEHNATADNRDVEAKFLSNAMETHAKIKTNVLETLSENHSKVRRRNAANKTTTTASTNVVPTITEDVAEDHETTAIEKDKENIITEQQQQLETQLPTESLPANVIATATPLTAYSSASSSSSSSSTKLSQETEKSTHDKQTAPEAAAKKDEVAKKPAPGPHTVEILSNELIDLNKTNTNAITEILQTKEVSPKKTNPTRFTPLVINIKKYCKLIFILKFFFCFLLVHTAIS